MPKRKRDDILSFKEVGVQLNLDDLVLEFRLMRESCAREPTPEAFRRIGLGSGTHLVKFTAPRTTLSESVIRFYEPFNKNAPEYLCSVNAPDIPFAKIVFRPLCIVEYETNSLVGHILSPNSISERVFAAFSEVFGSNSLEQLQTSLHEKIEITNLPDCGEFPIVFIPRPGGGDLQVTPVSPAQSFNGMKRVSRLCFERAQSDGARYPYFPKQKVSDKMQNISGAVGGARRRFLARMPQKMSQVEAALYRYVNGGRFPELQDREILEWILRYSDMLELDSRYSNQSIRKALNGLADRLIKKALDFIEETTEEAIILAKKFQFSINKDAKTPSPVEILIRQRWKTKQDYTRAKEALSSSHFSHRIDIVVKSSKYFYADQKAVN
ncbi:MAG: hypothetical protein OXC62_07425 [Aestuariivita sp.]|nr:hypothetical protein [Aestuariivita sp.]